jgi:hypothetical protein
MGKDISLEKISPGRFLEMISRGDQFRDTAGANGLIYNFTNNTFSILFTVAVRGAGPLDRDVQKANSFLSVKTPETLVLLSIAASGVVTTIYPQRSE